MDITVLAQYKIDHKLLIKTQINNCFNPRTPTTRPLKPQDFYYTRKQILNRQICKVIRNQSSMAPSTRAHGLSTTSINHATTSKTT